MTNRMEGQPGGFQKRIHTGKCAGRGGKGNAGAREFLHASWGCLTNSHRFRGLKQCRLILSQLWEWAGLIPSRGFGSENSFLPLFQLLEDAHIPWCVAPSSYHSDPCFCYHISFSDSGPPAPSYKDTHAWRASPVCPGTGEHSQFPYTQGQAAGWAGFSTLTCSYEAQVGPSNRSHGPRLL